MTPKRMPSISGDLGSEPMDLESSSSRSPRKDRASIESQSVVHEPLEFLWDQSLDPVDVNPTVEYIPKSELTEFKELPSWNKTTHVKTKMNTSIDKEKHFFCNRDILEKLLSLRECLKKESPGEIEAAAVRANVFNDINKTTVFHNKKEALVLSNLNYLFNLIPREKEESVPRKIDIFYYADLCADPGGFSEYILRLLGWQARGFAFSSGRMSPQHLWAASTESLDVLFKKNDTDICIPENIGEFRSFVRKSGAGQSALHLVLANGNVKSDESQEIAGKELFLAQSLIALKTLRKGGSFICRLSDTFTPFTVGIIYLLRNCFETVALVKPAACDPASPERYLVCQIFCASTSAKISNYLHELHLRLRQVQPEGYDLANSVPMNMMDGQFRSYMLQINNILAQKESVQIEKLLKYLKNPFLAELRQTSLGVQCLDLWKIPKEPSRKPRFTKPNDLCFHLLKDENSELPVSKFTSITPKILSKMKGSLNYHWMVLGSQTHFFLLGLGGTDTYIWNGRDLSDWTPASFTVELPYGTLLYGELVRETKREENVERSNDAFHIIDAMSVAEWSLEHHPYTDRMTAANKLTKSLSKPSCPQLIPLRPKDPKRLDEISILFDSLENDHRSELNCSLYKGRTFRACGILIFRTVKAPWVVAKSKTTKKQYFFNSKQKISEFDCPIDAVIAFRETMKSYLFWDLDDTELKLLTSGKEPRDKVHRDTVLDWLHNQRSA